MEADPAIHLGSGLDPSTLDALADFVCGDDLVRFPTYRSSSYLTRFFQGAGIEAVHDGSTRKWWVLDVLTQLDPPSLERVILRLVDLREYKGTKDKLKVAVSSMNEILAMDNLAVGFKGVQPVLRRAAPIDFDQADLTTPAPIRSEEEFLSKQFSDEIVVADLGLDAVITSYLQQRVNEAQSCPKDRVPLGTIFLLGSTLEGILLAAAVKDPRKYMSSGTAPKDRTGKVKKIHEWKLSELIDVAESVSAIGLDVKKFSHVLRDFRNFIHPYEQMSQGFQPDQHTVDICWQVFKAAFNQLKESGV